MIYAANRGSVGSSSDFGKVLEVVATLLNFGADVSVVNKVRHRHACDSVWHIVMTQLVGCRRATQHCKHLLIGTLAAMNLS